MPTPPLQPDLILTLDYSGVIQYARMQTEGSDVTGGQLEQLIGQPWRDTCEASNRAKVDRLVQQTIDHEICGYSQINQQFPGGDTALFEFVAVRDDTRHLRVIGKNLKAVVRMQNKLLDAQRSVETEIWKLRELEARYTTLANTNSDAILIVSDPDLQIIDANTQARRHIGLGVGDRMSELVLTEHDNQKMQKLLETAKQSGRAPLSILTAGVTQESWRVRVSSYTIQGSMQYMLQFSLHNLRNRLSHADAAGSISFGDIVTHLPDGMVAVDSSNIITHVNPAFAALVNRDNSDELLGEPADRWLQNNSLTTLRKRLDDEDRINDFPGHIHTSPDQANNHQREVLLSARRLETQNAELMLMVVRPAVA